MKIEAFASKLDSWTDMFEPFITSDKCDAIYKQLKTDSSRKMIIYPNSNDTFRAFKECHKDNLKLVMISMEPYSGKYYEGNPQATGLALDCSNGKIQPSLEAFLRGIAKEYNLPYADYYKTNDLSYLAEQGVLLANRSLTVRKDQIGSHVGLWDELWAFFFERLQSEHPNTPVLFLGKEAVFLRRYIFEMANPFKELMHPSAAARIHEDWDTKGTFENLNFYLRNHKDYAINWSNVLYKEKKQKLKEVEDDKDNLTEEQYNHQKMVINCTGDSLLPF